MLLKNVQYYKDGAFEKTDIRITGPDKRDIFFGFYDINDEHVIDLKGKYIIPGLVDVHVHLRQPGYEYKETIKTGTQAAAAGGFTAICAMPNVNPVPDNVDVVKKINDIIERDACINTYQYASITQKGEGVELSDFASLSSYVPGFSDDGSPVESDDLMKKAMESALYNESIIVAHCEDFAYQDPQVSEYMNLKRDIELLRNIRCRYHVCHVSSKLSIDLIRNAKKEGLNITCETTPHYLLFTKENLVSDNFRMNPPLGSVLDRQALVDALADGTIDVIATDHAPHSAEDKKNGAFGVIGLETAFSVMYTNFVRKGIISMQRLIELMSINPQRIFEIPGYADFTVVDLDNLYTIKPEEFMSKGRNTPFADIQVYGRVVMTICKGKIVWRYSS